jgi:hypothetical protein
MVILMGDAGHHVIMTRGTCSCVAGPKNYSNCTPVSDCGLLSRPFRRLLRLLLSRSRIALSPLQQLVSLPLQLGLGLPPQLCFQLPPLTALDLLHRSGWQMKAQQMYKQWGFRQRLLGSPGLLD